MGMKKLDWNMLPGYPMGIGDDTDMWPCDPATRKTLHFNQRIGKQDNAINLNGTQKVANRICTIGPQMRMAEKILESIIPGKTEKAVHAKYMHMPSEYWKTDKK